MKKNEITNLKGLLQAGNSGPSSWEAPSAVATTAKDKVTSNNKGKDTPKWRRIPGGNDMVGVSVLDEAKEDNENSFRFSLLFLEGKFFSFLFEGSLKES